MIKIILNILWILLNYGLIIIIIIGLIIYLIKIRSKK